MSQDHSTELNALTKKRETLEKLVQFAVQITRLLDSMEAVQGISKPDQVPQHKRAEFVNAISNRVQHLSSTDLQARLGKLDDLVKKDLSRILKIADTSESDYNRYIAPIANEAPQNSADWLNKSVYEFKRRSQTSAALRIVLIDQGVTVPNVELSVSPENIRRQIESLKQRESVYRMEMISQVNNLLEDVEKFVGNPTFPEELKQHMLTLREELGETKKVLESGKSIESLPMVVHYIDIDNSDPFTLPASGEMNEEPAVEKAEAAKPPAPAAKEENANTAKPAPRKAPRTESARTEPLKLDIPAIKLGFFKKIMVWLSTPWYVKWKDIEKYHASQLNKKAS